VVQGTFRTKAQGRSITECTRGTVKSLIPSHTSKVPQPRVLIMTESNTYNRCKISLSSFKNTNKNKNHHSHRPKKESSPRVLHCEIGMPAYKSPWKPCLSQAKLEMKHSHLRSGLHETPLAQETSHNTYQTVQESWY
jgi:hypothetical protein